MNIKEDIRSISYIKANSADVLSQVNETHRPVYITQNGEAKAVLLDTESYESMNKAIGLLKTIALGEKDIINGNLVEQGNLFASIEKRFN